MKGKSFWTILGMNFGLALFFFAFGFAFKDLTLPWKTLFIIFAIFILLLPIVPNK